MEGSGQGGGGESEWAGWRGVGGMEGSGWGRGVGGMEESGRGGSGVMFTTPEGASAEEAAGNYIMYKIACIRAQGSL